MNLEKLSDKIMMERKRLNNLLEQNADIQREEIIRYSQELDQLIMNYYSSQNYA